MKDYRIGVKEKRKVQNTLLVIFEPIYVGSPLQNILDNNVVVPE